MDYSHWSAIINCSYLGVSAAGSIATSLDLSGQFFCRIPQIPRNTKTLCLLFVNKEFTVYPQFWELKHCSHPIVNVPHCTDLFWALHLKSEQRFLGHKRHITIRSLQLKSLNRIISKWNVYFWVTNILQHKIYFQSSWKWEKNGLKIKFNKTKYKCNDKNILKTESFNLQKN